jgi:1-phosphofructokinase
MTAALAVAAARGLAFEDGLRVAAAAAALNVSRHGLGTGRRDSIEDIAGRVEITPVRGRLGEPTTSAALLAGMTKAELYERAKRLDIAGRSTMRRGELLMALGGNDDGDAPAT